MKLFSLSVLYKGTTKSNLLKAAYDLSSFSFFQKSRWDWLFVYLSMGQFPWTQIKPCLGLTSSFYGEIAFRLRFSLHLVSGKPAS